MSFLKVKPLTRTWPRNLKTLEEKKFNSINFQDSSNNIQQTEINFVGHFL